MTTAVASSPVPGQNHDRFGDSDSLRSHTMLSTKAALDAGGEPADITPFQKMLSATTGSLLTGLTSTLDALTSFCVPSTLYSDH